MIRSLLQHCPQMKMYILCMDDQTKVILEQFQMPYVQCISLPEVESEELLHAKASRGIAEYCWTLSSSFTWYVMQNFPEIDFLTYVDADLLFYSDVQPIFDEIGDASIAIIEHRFTKRLKQREVNGRFCVEWNSFRRDDQGLACLKKWREQCIEWCYYRLEDGKFGDQKYLDTWPNDYSKCHIVMHAGAGIAPWNFDQYHFDQDSKGNITIEGEPLIFYHFHQFQILQNGTFDRLSNFYTAKSEEPDGVYNIYEDQLTNILTQVRAIDSTFTAGIRSNSKLRIRRALQEFMPFWMKEIGRRFFRY